MKNAHAFKSLGLAGLLALFLQPAYAQDTALAQENFQQADASGDGDLDYAEFVVFINLNADDNLGNAARIRKANLHQRAFKRIDANGDSIVTPTELEQAAR